MTRFQHVYNAIENINNSDDLARLYERMLEQSHLTNKDRLEITDWFFNRWNIIHFECPQQYACWLNLKSEHGK